jgi:hypothetical protein
MAKLKDTKEVIRIRKTKRDIHHNGQGLSLLVLRILITPLVSLSLAIVMSVPLRLTDSDYSFSIFKLGHCDVCPS